MLSTKGHRIFLYLNQTEALGYTHQFVSLLVVLLNIDNSDAVLYRKDKLYDPLMPTEYSTISTKIRTTVQKLTFLFRLLQMLMTIENKANSVKTINKNVYISISR